MGKVSTLWSCELRSAKALLCALSLVIISRVFRIVRGWQEEHIVSNICILISACNPSFGSSHPPRI